MTTRATSECFCLKAIDIGIVSGNEIILNASLSFNGTLIKYFLWGVP